MLLGIPEMVKARAFQTFGIVFTNPEKLLGSDFWEL